MSHTSVNKIAEQKSCSNSSNVKFIAFAERRRLCFLLCWIVTLSVCLFVCYGIMHGRIFMKFSVGQDTTHNLEKLGRGIAVSGGVMFNPFHTRLLFKFFKEIRVCQQHYGKTDPQIFMKFLRKVAHETRNRREHFQGVAVNHLNPGFFFSIFWICIS